MRGRWAKKEDVSRVHAMRCHRSQQPAPQTPRRPRLTTPANRGGTGRCIAAQAPAARKRAEPHPSRLRVVVASQPRAGPVSPPGRRPVPPARGRRAARPEDPPARTHDPRHGSGARPSRPRPRSCGGRAASPEMLPRGDRRPTPRGCRCRQGHCESAGCPTNDTGPVRLNV